MRADLELRAASVDDWDLVRPHFERNYRRNHPFQSKDYWEWHVGSPADAGAVLAIADREIVGFRGYQVGGGFTWGMMTFVAEASRGTSLVWALMKYFDEVTKDFGPAASTNSNRNMVRLYRHLEWYRSADLVRTVAVRPGLRSDPLAAVPAQGELPSPDGRYWRQPGLRGVVLDTGTGVAQHQVGGFRLVETHDPGRSLQEVWDLGFNWVDYVTSWNDPVLDQMDEEAGWLQDSESPVPWLVDPVVPESRAHVTVFSSVPLPPDFIIRRDYSDHGRVGSLPRTET